MTEPPLVVSGPAAEKNGEHKEIWWLGSAPYKLSRSLTMRTRATTPVAPTILFYVSVSYL